MMNILLVIIAITLTIALIAMTALLILLFASEMKTIIKENKRKWK